MNFELNHLDMTGDQSESSTDALINARPPATSSFSNTLDELSRQIEDLQNKLKVSYKKLFSYEVQHKKLLEEKSYYFYENKGAQELLSLTNDKIKALESRSIKLENELKSAIQKLEVHKEINATQRSDLIRFTKFHTKIKTVIKPQIQKMKEDMQALQSENNNLKLIVKTQNETLEENDRTINVLKNSLDETKKLAVFQKNELTQAYEEQIHHLSKDVLDMQNKIEEQDSSILRLKKQVETKNFLENELIKFKRINNEEVQKNAHLETQVKALSLQITSHADNEQRLMSRIQQLELDLADKTQQEDSLRTQLSSWIAENEKLQLRLKMFEKLNLQLSQSIQGRSHSEPQIES